MNQENVFTKAVILYTEDCLSYKCKQMLQFSHFSTVSSGGYSDKGAKSLCSFHSSVCQISSNNDPKFPPTGGKCLGFYMLSVWLIQEIVTGYQLISQQQEAFKFFLLA